MKRNVIDWIGSVSAGVGFCSSLIGGCTIFPVERWGVWGIFVGLLFAVLLGVFLRYILGFEDGTARLFFYVVGYSIPGIIVGALIGFGVIPL